MPKQERLGGEKSNADSVIPSIYPEKKESAKMDSAYFSSVSRFFNDAKANVMRKGEDATEDDLNASSYLESLSYDLTKLANPKLLEKTQPKDISFAASYLLGVMASSNPETHPDDAGNEILEKAYADAKGIFMATCKKIFPDVKKDSGLQDLNMEIMALNKLGVWQDPEGKIEGIVPYVDSQKLLKENPRGLAQEIDNSLHLNGTGMAAFANNEFENFNFNDGELDREDRAKSRLAVGIKSMYKIQLMRDELTKQMYGRTDITPAEIREIESTRNKAK